MYKIQKKFLEFYDRIKLNDQDKNELRNKRDILLNYLKNHLDIPFESFYQGSYSMHIGVKPIKGHDYDIDIGLVFKAETLNEKQINNAFKIKEKIALCLDHYQRKVKIKEPCVTVQYTLEGNNRYHVDFAVYKEKNNSYYLARGKDNENYSWEKSDPKKLKEDIIIINKDISREARDQYRRCICYLKRWKQLKLNHKNFPSIALAIIAHKISIKEDDADIDVLLKFLEKIKNDIHHKTLLFPYYPCNNLFEKLSDNQSLEFEKKIGLLIEDLNRINADDISESEACDVMRKHFGCDFPIGISNRKYNNTEQFIENMYNISDLKNIIISRKILNYKNHDVSRFWKDKILSGIYHLCFKVENVHDFRGNTCFFWKVRNVGAKAETLNDIRGQILKRGIQIDEYSKFQGNHYIECYAIKNDVCIGIGSINVVIGPCQCMKKSLKT